jgi:branched-chain amino acid transport system permease protein
VNFLSSNRTLLLTILLALLVTYFALNGMSAATAVSIVLSGLTLGALYFLVASGLSLIFGLMDVLNFAHGSLFMLGAYAGWTIYTNPRLILNTAPLALALIAGVMLLPLVARRVNLPRVARWILVFVATALVLFAVRDFPLQKLVAFGTTVAGQVVPTNQAQESLETMLLRVALMFVAGVVISFAWARQESQQHTKPPISFISLISLLCLAFVLLFTRDFLEQLILSTDTNLRFALALLVGAGTGAGLGALMEFGLIRPLYARPIYQVLLTLGLVFISDQVVRLVWGPAGAFMEMPSWFANSGDACPSNFFDWFNAHCDSILVLGRPFPSYRLFIIFVGVMMLVGIAILLRRSRQR